MRSILTPGLALLVLLATHAHGADITDLIKQLGASDSTKRREAAQALAEAGMEAKAALPALRRAAVKDKDAYVRRYSTQALGKVSSGDPETIKALVAATGDENDRVQEAAAAALASLGKPAAEALLSVARDQKKTPQVRKKAIKGLGEIGPDARSSRTIAALAEIVSGKVKGKMPKGKTLTDDDIRPDAATALGNIATADDTEALTALRSVAEGKQRNRALQQAAAAALKKVTGEVVKKKKK
jgi:HEAT repeat protein